MLPTRLRTGSVVATVIYFVLGIPLNAISRSKPERFTMVPVTIVLSILSLLVPSG